MCTYSDICKANELIKTTDIKGKEYAEVHQRIKAFRSVFPQGTIETEMISCENGVCIFKAEVYGDEDTLLGTGHAQEKESSSFINKTSYIENCETSAVGRALGMCGFGIDTSIASAEEVLNAINNQTNKHDENKTSESDTSNKTKAPQKWPLDNIKRDLLKHEMERTGIQMKNILCDFKLASVASFTEDIYNTVYDYLKHLPDAPHVKR